MNERIKEVLGTLLAEFPDKTNKEIAELAVLLLPEYKETSMVTYISKYKREYLKNQPAGDIAYRVNLSECSEGQATQAKKLLMEFNGSWVIVNPTLEQLRELYGYNTTYTIVENPEVIKKGLVEERVKPPYDMIYVDAMYYDPILIANVSSNQEFTKEEAPLVHLYDKLVSDLEDKDFNKALSLSICTNTFSNFSTSVSLDYVKILLKAFGTNLSVDIFTHNTDPEFVDIIRDIFAGINYTIYFTVIEEEEEDDEYYYEEYEDEDDDY